MAYDFSQKNARSFVKISNWIWDCEREVHALSLSLSPFLSLSLSFSFFLSLSLSFMKAPSLLSSLSLSLSLKISNWIRECERFGSLALPGFYINLFSTN